jgi:hypothetical protein
MSMSSPLSQRLRALILAVCAVVVAGLAAGVASSLAVNLPDGRAYEEVTPVHMDGGQSYPDLASPDGNKLFYSANKGFTGESGGYAHIPYVAERTSTGWQTHSLLPPAAQYSAAKLWSHIEDWSSDFKSYLIELGPPFFDPSGGAKADEYLVEAGGGNSFTATNPIDTTPHGDIIQTDETKTEQGSEIEGASSDLSHVVRGLIPSRSGQSLGRAPLFDVTGFRSGVPHSQLVEVTGPNNADGSGTLITDCGAILGSGTWSTVGHTAFHAVSSDGSKIFFETNPGSVESLFYPSPWCTFGPPVREIFARVNDSQTTPISEPSVAYCPEINPSSGPGPNGGPFGTNALCKSAQFEGASMDGSKVFFTTTQAEVPGDADTTNDLYEYDFARPAGQNLVEVSAGDATAGTPGSEHADVKGVVRISDDGSHVYFVAQGVLTTTPGPEDQTAQNGADNLYVYDEGTTKFIGELCSGLSLSGSVADSRCPSVEGDSLWGGVSAGVAGVDNHAAWAAPFGSTIADGRFLVFDTVAQLIAAGPEADTDTAQDVYKYDSQTGALVRVSTGRDGADHNGNNDSFAATIPTIDNLNYGANASGELRPNKSGEGRPVSNDGSYVFFSTSGALESDDVNDAPDVYEWHNGLVSLISDGQNPGKLAYSSQDVEVDANLFIGSSETGSDVFFESPDVLVPQGGFSSEVIYDARIGGGFQPASAPPPCREDACQGSISATPTFPLPTSASYVGEGNLPTVVAPAAKPKVKKAAKPKKKPKKRKTAKQKSKGRKSSKRSVRGRR